VSYQQQKKFYEELQQQFQQSFDQQQTVSYNFRFGVSRSPGMFKLRLVPLPCENSKHYDPPIPYDTEDFRKLVQQDIVRDRLAKQANCAHHFVTVKERGTQICIHCQQTRQAA
jgi:hypothetical protein